MRPAVPRPVLRQPILDDRQDPSVDRRSEHSASIGRELSRSEPGRTDQCDRVRSTTTPLPPGSAATSRLLARAADARSESPSRVSRTSRRSGLRPLGSAGTQSTRHRSHAARPHFEDGEIADHWSVDSPEAAGRRNAAQRVSGQLLERARPEKFDNGVSVRPVASDHEQRMDAADDRRARCRTSSPNPKKSRCAFTAQWIVATRSVVTGRRVRSPARPAQ